MCLCLACSLTSARVQYFIAFIIFIISFLYNYILYSYEHVVYALDGLIYTLTHWPKEATDICRLNQIADSPSRIEEVNEIKKKYSMEVLSESKNVKYYLRPESVRAKEEADKSNEQFFTPASSPGPSLGPLQEAFPFAKQPHLLQPFVSKEQLFSSPARSNTDGIDTNDAESMEQDSNSMPSIVSYSHLSKRLIVKLVIHVDYMNKITLCHFGNKWWSMLYRDMVGLLVVYQFWGMS